MRERVELYVRTYRTLRSAGETRLRILEGPHIEMHSALHPGAGDPRPDMGALIYALQRLPACIPSVRQIVLGQSTEAIGGAIGADVGGWQAVASPAAALRRALGRRRTAHRPRLSESDVDDLIPTAVAYQIEWNAPPRAAADGSRRPTGRRALAQWT